MAEYVRRKRPPADHPFWAHLNDRAHPPSVVWPVAVPAGVGLALGLTAGLNDRLTLSDALETAATISGTLAVTIAIGIAIPMLFAAVRRPRVAENWLAVGGVFVAVGGGAFGLLVLLMGLILLWYSACSGLGPWLGMTVGAAIGVGPGVLFAWVQRHRWTARRRQWPRWETMRRRHRRQTAAAVGHVQPIAVPVSEPPPPSADDNPTAVAG